MTTALSERREAVEANQWPPVNGEARPKTTVETVEVEEARLIADGVAAIRGLSYSILQPGEPERSVNVRHSRQMQSTRWR